VARLDAFDLAAGRSTGVLALVRTPVEQRTWSRSRKMPTPRPRSGASSTRSCDAAVHRRRDFTLADIALGAYARRWFGVEGISKPPLAHLERWFAQLRAARDLRNSSRRRCRDVQLPSGEPQIPGSLVHSRHGIRRAGPLEQHNANDHRQRDDRHTRRVVQLMRGSPTTAARNSSRRERDIELQCTRLVGSARAAGAACSDTTTPPILTQCQCVELDETRTIGGARIAGAGTLWRQQPA